MSAQFAAAFADDANCKVALDRKQLGDGFTFPSMDDSSSLNTNAFPDLNQQMNEMHSISSLRYGGHTETAKSDNFQIAGAALRTSHGIDASGMNTHPPRTPSSPLTTSAIRSSDPLSGRFPTKQIMSNVKPFEAPQPKSTAYVRNYSNRKDILLLTAINAFLDPSPAKLPMPCTSPSGAAHIGGAQLPVRTSATDLAAILATALAAQPCLASYPPAPEAAARGRQTSMPPPPPRLPSAGAASGRQQRRNGVAGVRRPAVEPLSLGPGDPDRSRPRRRL
jgi:hypothetical protein